MKRFITVLFLALIFVILLPNSYANTSIEIILRKALWAEGLRYRKNCKDVYGHPDICFKGKKVAVVGGGNSALIESVFLKQIGCKEVYLIHRRDQLRAEKAYEDDAKEKQIQILFNKVVESIGGKEKVEFLDIRDTVTNKKSKLDVDGVFVSIGEIPQNILAKKLKVKLDEHGYIITDKQQRTNIKGVYAAGDITGGLRQVITACAEGAVAALSSTEALGKKYPY